MARVGVVSGGGTGIGRAIARQLAGDGFRVVIVGRRPEVLEKAAAELAADLGGAPDAEAGGVSGNGGVEWRQADLSVVADVERLVEDLGRRFGTIDAVVNNAGSVSTAPTGSLAELAAAWRADFEANVLSAALLTHGALPLLRRPGGRIILIGSMSTRSGGGSPSYVAAKSALNGWVLALTARLAADGITANVVVPGYVPGTGLGGGAAMPAAIHDRVVSRIATGRPGRPEDTAAMVGFLCSAAAEFVNGQVIEVNGGTVPPNM